MVLNFILAQKLLLNSRILFFIKFLFYKLFVASSCMCLYVYTYTYDINSLCIHTHVCMYSHIYVYICLNYMIYRWCRKCNMWLKIQDAQTDSLLRSLALTHVPF